MTVTITGTNDAVTVTSSAQTGAATEDNDAHAVDANGTVTFTDADLRDGHTASFVAAAANSTALGSFALTSVSEAAGAAGGSVGWSYVLNNGAANYLAAGEQVTETYTVTLDDGNGSTTTQNVTVTITGTNDAVSVTSGAQSGAATEDNDAAAVDASGTVTFTDGDLRDGHTASFVAAAANSTALGSFALTSVSEAAGAAGGSVGWGYTLNNGAANYLAAGEQVTEAYTITLDDGNGSTTTQDVTVTVTITGTNDAVSVTSGVQAGAATEDNDAAAVDASGTVTFTDADLRDGHTASFTPAAGNTTALGSFSLTGVSEASGAAVGSVGWNYTLNNGAANYLAAGEQVNETYTITLDDGNGSTTTQNVTVTITGINDALSVTSGTQAGAATEDNDAQAVDASGTVTFTDADLRDGHTASFVAAAANSTALGSFALTSVSEAAGAAGGSVGWNYILNNGAANYLAAGEQVAETYTVTLNDGNGSTTTQDVTVTITGTNDAVSVTSGAQAGAATEDNDTQAVDASGTVTFTDADLRDGHTASFVAAAANSTALGSFALTSVSEAAGAAGGSVGWSYTLNNGAANYLAAGEQVTETYTITLDDGNGSTTNQNVTVTITGTNDAVSVTSGAQSGAATEDNDAAAVDASGAVTFTDADLRDGHTASFAAAAGNATALGSFSLTGVNEAAGAAGGSVGWSYTVNNGAANYLAVGEQVTETYTVTVDDGNGSTTTQEVTVTITGTNDAVSVTSGAQSGAATEDNDATAVDASGTVTFTDGDLRDGHTASFAPAAGNPTALGNFALTGLSEAAGAAGGSVGWTYTLNNGAANYLAAGEQVTETYTITLDDANGSTTTQDVTVTITGTNDAVSVTSGVQAGAATEDNDALAVDASGTVTFTDADLRDGHTPSFVPATANTTALGNFTLASVSEAAGAAGGSVGWSYTLNNGAANYLAAGQQVVEIYTVTLDDGNGSTTAQDVTVTITGSNDAVNITSGAQGGTATEDNDAQPVDASGTVSFTDADLRDGHSAAFAAAAANTTALGNFALTGVSEAAGAAGGTLGWTYTLHNGAANYLAAGAQVTETYTITLDDGHGSTTSQDVTVTINGRNDTPSLADTTNPVAVAEAANASAQNLAPIVGTFSVSDSDVGNALTPSLVGSPVVLLDGAAFALPTGAAALAANGAFTLTGATSNGGTVNIGYTYDPSAANLDFLRAGQNLTVTYTVRVGDGTATSNTQDVTFTIVGANDAPLAAADTVRMNTYLTTTVNPPTAASTPIINETSTNNNDFGGAQLINRTDLRIAPNPDLTNQSSPSVSLKGRISDVSDQDFYKIDLLAGETIVLDVDYARKTGGGASSENLDSYMFLYIGTSPLTSNDDAAPASIGGTGSVVPQDSYISYAAATSGTYYVMLKDYDGGGQSSYGDYVLQMSVANYQATTTTSRPISFSAAALLANDSDPDANILAVTSVSGTGVSLSNGVITVDPGVSSFSYTISDGAGGTSTAGVNVVQSTGSTLTGTSGADVLAASNAGDTVIGAGGTDILSGGAGSDLFVFQATSDSVAGAGRDLILDFLPGSDRIDLTGIDANNAIAGNDAFTFIGSAAFTNVAGQMRAEGQNGQTIVSLDVDGDGAADSQLALVGIYTLNSGDFLL